MGDERVRKDTVSVSLRNYRIFLPLINSVLTKLPNMFTLHKTYSGILIIHTDPDFIR
jgi:hypothetical protein